MEKRLYVGFKGKNNASSLLVEELSGNRLLLTNSFLGLKKDIDNIDKSFNTLYMFGIDKNLRNKVRIEMVAEREGIKRHTNMDVVNIVQLLEKAGIDNYTSEIPTHYLCNEAYWHALEKFGGEVVFIHIPPVQYIDECFIERIKLALT